MAASDIASVTIRGISAAWLKSGFEVTNGQLTAGTMVEKGYNFIKDQTPTYPPSATSSTSSFISIRANNQVTAEEPEVTQVVSLSTGVTKEGGSSGGSGDKISFTMYDTTPETIAYLAALRGKPVLCCIPHGENANGSVAYYYILGELSADIAPSFTESPSEVTVEITGKEYSGTAADAELAWAPAEVFPIGVQDATAGNGVTPTASVAGDATTLRSGKIVQK